MSQLQTEFKGKGHRISSIVYPALGALGTGLFVGGAVSQSPLGLFAGSVMAGVGFSQWLSQRPIVTDASGSLLDKKSGVPILIGIFALAGAMGAVGMYSSNYNRFINGSGSDDRYMPQDSSCMAMFETFHPDTAVLTQNAGLVQLICKPDGPKSI